MFSTNIINDVKINNNINNDAEDDNICINEQYTIDNECQSTKETTNFYSKNTRCIKYFYKYSLAFLVFTSWVYGLSIVSLSKKTDHNIHSLTWIPFLLGSYINMLLFGFCYFIGDN